MNRLLLGFFALAGSLALLVVAGACAGDGGDAAAAPAAKAGPEPQHGGTLTFGNYREMASPHPFTTTRSADRNIKENMFEPLLLFDKEGQLQGFLAESWEINSDASVWTFKLREGVKFHNGQELTANDVVWTVNYIMNSDNGARGQRVLSADIKKIEAVDKYTVRFTMKAPRGLFGVTAADISKFSIIPADSMKQGDVQLESGTPPPGTGPFRFASWLPADSTEIVRNDDYWRGAPYLDKIVFKLIGKTSGRENALRAGDIQIAERVSVQFAQRVQSGELTGMIAESANLSGFARIEFNHTSEWLSKRAMRLAMTIAIDKDAFMDEVFFGVGKPVDAFVPEGSDWEKAMQGAGVVRRERNLERVKQLLKEAGYKGEPIAFILTRQQQEEAESSYRMLQEAGINVELNVLESGVYDKRQIDGDYDFSTGGGRWGLDPVLSQQTGWRCEEGSRRANTSAYCNPEVDRLSDVYLTVADHQRHLDLWGKIAKIMYDDVFELSLGWKNSRYFAWLETAHDFAQPGTGSYNTYNAGLKTTWLEQK